MEFCKTSRSADDRLKIIKVVENLKRSYEHLGLSTKALDFLEWAHDFVKVQTK